MGDRRYLIFRHWPWYTVHAGTGTRILFKSLRWKPAARIAAELETAFADGKYVEYVHANPGSPDLPSDAVEKQP
jgi:hypothetical protein